MILAEFPDDYGFDISEFAPEAEEEILEAEKDFVEFGSGKEYE